jgi:hypothetical protein
MKQKCAICYKEIQPDCTWRQGRCPHIPSMAESIMNDSYKSRFLNLINFLRGRKNDKTN